MMTTLAWPCLHSLPPRGGGGGGGQRDGDPRQRMAHLHPPGPHPHSAASCETRCLRKPLPQLAGHWCSPSLCGRLRSGLTRRSPVSPPHRLVAWQLMLARLLLRALRGARGRAASHLMERKIWPPVMRADVALPSSGHCTVAMSEFVSAHEIRAVAIAVFPQ